MKMIIRFMKDYKKESILAPLFKMLEAMLELLVPLVVAAIIDKGIYWSFVFHHSAVFRGKIGGGSGFGHALPAVFAHFIIWIQGNG